MVNRSFLTLDDKPLSGKTVFVRVDLNCPVDEKTKKPQLSPRITAHARTVLDLSLSGAKTVLLAHQGRAGDDDFTSLEFHAKLLQKEVAKLAKKTGEKAASGEKKSAPGEKKPAPKIKFVDDVCGEKSKGAIKALKAGEVILLQNVRYLDDETKFEKNGGKSELVSNLSQFCDIFVLDAFSCAHRAHASVVGFSSKPCLAGRVMAQELGALESFHNPKPPVVFVMGGAKPDDSLPILASWLEAKKLDYALCGGVLGSLMLLASGRKLGETEEFLAKKEVLVKLDDARALIAKYSKQIVLPIDMVVDDKGKAKILEVSELPSLNSISDIGPKTSKHFGGIISTAGSIVMNGPMGVYEKDEFSNGTKKVLEAVSKSSGFSLLGGGHTLSALDKFKIDRSHLGYVSLSGKALIEYLSGEKLPGVEMLRAWSGKAP